MRGFVWMAILMYALNGLTGVALGSVLPLFLKHYGVSYTVGGELIFLQFIGFLVGVSISSLLVRYIGHRLTLVAACLSIAIADLCMGMLPSLPWAAALCFVNGLGLAFTQATIASSIMEWFPGRRAVVMSRLEVAFGIGSLTMPLASSFLIAVHAWRFGFLAVGVISVLLVFLLPFVPIGRAEEAHEGPRDALTELPELDSTARKSLLLVLFLGMIFVYVGLESCFSNFLPAIFISSVKLGPSTSSLSVTFFWISMVIGRTLTGFVARKVAYARFLMWSIGATLVLIVLLSFLQSDIFAFLIVCLIGLSMSGIFVIILVFANHAFTGREQLVTRLVTAFAGLGGAFIPMLFGWLMDHSSVRINLWCLAGFTLLLLAMLTAIGRINTGRRSRERYVTS